MSADEFDLARVLASKRAYRQQLAARPLVEKLHLLDELRERALAIQRSSRPHHPSEGRHVGEDSPRYGTEQHP